MVLMAPFLPHVSCARLPCLPSQPTSPQVCALTSSLPLVAFAYGATYLHTCFPFASVKCVLPFFLLFRFRRWCDPRYRCAITLLCFLIARDVQRARVLLRWRSVAVPLAAPFGAGAASLSLISPSLTWKPWSAPHLFAHMHSPPLRCCRLFTFPCCPRGSHRAPPRSFLPSFLFKPALPVVSLSQVSKHSARVEALQAESFDWTLTQV